ncbi:hypothetical protein [Azospirillum largimobile]
MRIGRPQAQHSGPLRAARPEWAPWGRAAPVLADFGFGSHPSEAGCRPYSAMVFPLICDDPPITARPHE